MIECRVPRLWGHYNRDIEHYRPKEDRDQARARDPIVTFSSKLIAAGVLTAGTFHELEADVKSEMDDVQQAVLSAPRPDPSTASTHVWSEAPLQPASSSAPKTEETKNRQLYPGSQRSIVARVGHVARTSSSMAKTSARREASLAPREVCKRTMARIESSTRRSPRAPSSAQQWARP